MAFALDLEEAWYFRLEFEVEAEVEAGTRAPESARVRPTRPA